MSSNESDKQWAMTKFPAIGQPPQPDHPTVTAILDSQEIVSRQGWARRMVAWDDPDRCPPVHEVVAKAHRNLRRAMAADRITYDDHTADGASYDPDDPDGSAALVHFVGSDTVMVSNDRCRERLSAASAITLACSSCTRRCTTSTAGATAR